MLKMIKTFIKIVAPASVLFLAAYFFIFPISIRGSSMQSTLFDGDRVVASRALGRLGFYETGDIIIFSEMVNDERRNMVKRVIAVENDEVEIKGGKVYVNDEPVSEKYISGYTRGTLKMTVPKGSVFVMGDNREESFDSRQYGAVKRIHVQAKVIAKVYPLREFKLY